MHYKESCYEVAKCIYHHVYVTRNVVIKLRNLYIVTSASHGKLIQGCGVYISSRLHHKVSCYKVAECIYHHFCITRKVAIKLPNVYIIACASQGMLF